MTNNLTLFRNDFYLRLPSSLKKKFQSLVCYANENHFGKICVESIQIVVMTVSEDENFITVEWLEYLIIGDSSIE